MGASKFSLKKQPVQLRSQFLVDSIKQAATQVLKLYGVEGFNTNIVAERAGVSIGSLYQYFESKEILVAEIKRDHFSQLRANFKQAQSLFDGSDINQVIDGFVDASMQGHLIDPQLHLILSNDLSDFALHENDESEDSIMPAVEAVLRQHQSQLRVGLDFAVAAQLCYQLVEKTIHASLAEQDFAKRSATIAAEIKQMLRAYLLP